MELDNLPNARLWALDVLNNKRLKADILAVISQDRGCQRPSDVHLYLTSIPAGLSHRYLPVQARAG